MTKTTTAIIVAALTAMQVGFQAWNSSERRKLAEIQYRASEDQRRTSEDHYQYERAIHIAVDNGEFVKLPEGWK